MSARRGLSSVYPGWWLAAGTSLSLGVVAGTTFWAFGLLAGPLEAEFGWSRSLIAAVASLTLLISGGASPLVGRLVDRWQPRRVILVGSAATAVAFALLSRITDLWQFLFLMAALAFLVDGAASAHAAREVAVARRTEGYTATRHQREVGAGYFDQVAQAVSGGESSTLALRGSTEEEQFDASSGSARHRS